MAAGKYNMLIQAGSTYNQTITLLGSDGVTPIDLTGASIAAMVRGQYSDPTPLAVFVCSILAPAINGKFNISLDEAVTAAMSLLADRGVYDIEITYPGGAKDRILQGNVVISKEATRP